MQNREIAAVLFNISAILSAQDDTNPYRIRAYRQAARNLLRARHSVAERAANKQPLGIPRLGKRLTEKITALALGDPTPFYDEICALLPPEQQALLRVPGFGPTMAARIHRDLGSFDTSELLKAIGTGRLQKVWGIGPKRTAAIIDTFGGQMARQEHMNL